jgi:hypothetical protein
MELKIEEPNGWSKVMVVDKSITRVGSGQVSDLILPSPEIDTLHLQLFYVPDQPSVCRILNLGSEVSARVQHAYQPLPPFKTIECHDQDSIALAGYTITFKLAPPEGQLLTSRNIEALLSFPEAILRPEMPLRGTISIKNAGTQPSCQFVISLSGLPDDCYQLDPIPLMYPGTQEEVSLVIFHRSTYPKAGPMELVLTVTAPRDYSGEELVIHQNIYVTPVMKQELALVDDLTNVAISKPAPAPAPTPTIPTPAAPVSAPVQQVAPPVQPAVHVVKDSAQFDLQPPQVTEEPSSPPTPVITQPPAPQPSAPVEVQRPAEQPPVVVQPPVEQPPTVKQRPAEKPPVVKQRSVKQPPVVKEAPAEQTQVVAQPRVEQPPVVAQPPAEQPTVVKQRPAEQPPVVTQQPAAPPPEKAAPPQPSTPPATPDARTAQSQAKPKVVQNKPDDFWEE